MILKWKYKSFSQLSKQDLYKILAMRNKIFIIEQECLYPDIDNLDQDAIHVMGCYNNELIAYARILIAQPNSMESHRIERVLVANQYRKKKIGELLFKNCLNYLKQNHSSANIEGSALYYLVDFYKKFGFTPIGLPYEQDKILHIKMIKYYST